MFGRTALISVSLFLLVGSFMMIQMLYNQKALTLEISREYDQIHRDNIKMAGTELVLSKLDDNPGWRNNYKPWETTIDGQTLEIVIDDYISDPNLLFTELMITTYTDTVTSSDSSVTYVKRGGTIPMIRAGMTFYTDTLNFNRNGGSFDISGEDTNIDGSAGNGNPVYAIKTDQQNTYDRIYNELSGANGGSDETGDITGKGSTPSMKVDSVMQPVDLTRLTKKYIKNADNIFSTGTYSSQTLGTNSNPEITVIDSGQTVRIDGGSGAGVLVVCDGATLELNADLQYNGVIVVNGTYDQMSGHIKLYGGLLFGSDVDPVQGFEATGNVIIRYSTEALLHAQEELNSRSAFDYKYEVTGYLD